VRAAAVVGTLMLLGGAFLPPARTVAAEPDSPDRHYRRACSVWAGRQLGSGVVAVGWIGGCGDRHVWIAVTAEEMAELDLAGRMALSNTMHAAIEGVVDGSPR